MNTITSELARRFINKWKSDSSTLHVALADDGEVEEFRSCVIELQDKFLILARGTFSGVWLFLSEAQFAYSEPSAADEPSRSRFEGEFSGCLEIAWPKKGRCLLFELVRADVNHQSRR